jgi:hypothetical protein
MSDDLGPAIAVFEQKLAGAERRVAEYRNAINVLLQAQGLPARYVEESGSPSVAPAPPTGSTATQIKRDSFYGKKQMTAIRELLEMRRTSGEGPATPKEVVVALKAGGYKFGTKNDEIALVGIRALMRKATTVFHKLPGTNAYGLTAWYPNAKTAAEVPTKAPKAAKRGRPPKASARPAAKPQRATRPKPNVAATPRTGSAISAFVESALADGTEWTTERLLQEAVSCGVEGITPSTSKQKFQGALLSLKQRGRATALGNGRWKGVPLGEVPSDDDRVVPMKGVA